MLLELLETVVVSAERRRCWAFAQLEAGSEGSADFASSAGSADSAVAADSYEHRVCCGHATSLVDRRFDVYLALGPGLGLGPGPGSCGSCCRLVRDARFPCRLDCVVMVCLRRLVVVRIAFASGA